MHLWPSFTSGEQAMLERGFRRPSDDLNTVISLCSVDPWLTQPISFHLDGTSSSFMNYPGVKSIVIPQDQVLRIE
jgi:hypothetical protein